MNDDTKAWPVCGEAVKAAAIKCRFCNTDLTPSAAAKEAESERTLFRGHPATIYSACQWLAAVATLGIAYLVYWFRSISTTTYEITSQRIRIALGLRE